MFVCFIRSRKMASAFGNMLLHGIGTDAQPVGCLLIGGDARNRAEAENGAGGFLQLPCYLLRPVAAGTHVPHTGYSYHYPGGLYQRLHVGLFHLLVLEPVEAGISHGCVRASQPNQALPATYERGADGSGRNIYEQILNAVDTGILVVDSHDNILQHNQAAHLGCSIRRCLPT